MEGAPEGSYSCWFGIASIWVKTGTVWCSYRLWTRRNSYPGALTPCAIKRTSLLTFWRRSPKDPPLSFVTHRPPLLSKLAPKDPHLFSICHLRIPMFVTKIVTERFKLRLPNHKIFHKKSRIFLRFRTNERPKLFRGSPKDPSFLWSPKTLLFRSVCHRKTLMFEVCDRTRTSLSYLSAPSWFKRRSIQR